MSARRRATLMLCAALQFVVLTPCAMATYAGGTLFDPTRERYDFFDNFFSDLGTTEAHSGRSNLLSCALFAVALASVGVAFVAFASSWRSFAFGRSRARLAGVGSQALGTTSGLCFIGVAVTPWNLVFVPHILLVLAAFALLVGYIVCLTILLWHNDGGRAQVAANLIYLVVLLGYVGLMFLGPSLLTPQGHVVQVTGQKLIVFASMINLMFQALSARRARSMAAVPAPTAAREESEER